MYSTLLALHSLFRWVVLAFLTVAIYRAYQGWMRNQKFTRMDNLLRHTAATVSHLQLILGVTLYFISPIVDYFLNNFETAVHQREVRFFGMEHITMMVIAIVLITIGSVKTQRRKTDLEKFKTMAVWYSFALFMIFISIPWKFSPLTSRPYLRSF